MASYGRRYGNPFPPNPAPEETHIITPWVFADLLQAAGIVHDIDRIRKISIIAKPDEAVTIEVIYLADERILSVANIAAHNKEQADAQDMGSGDARGAASQDQAQERTGSQEAGEEGGQEGQEGQEEQ